MGKLTQIREELAAKRGQWATLYQRTTEQTDGNDDNVAELQRLMKELNALGERETQFAAIEAEAAKNASELARLNAPVGGIPMPGEREEKGGQPSGGLHTGAARQLAKSLGQRFAESDGYKSWRRGGMGQTIGFDSPEVGFKATFTTGGSTFTQYDRQPGLVLIGQRRLVVRDLLAPGETTMNTIRYPQEDTFTNAATTVAEGGTKPEASWDTSEVDAPVRKIAVLSRVTDELFADFPMLRDYIDNRLTFMVQLTEEDQLLNGDGNAPNLTGILTVSGIQSQAKSTDPVPDAVFKAMVKVQYTGFFDPDGAVMNPTDWQGIALLRTADGLYIFGYPQQYAEGIKPVNYLWGMPVVITPSIAAGTALVGAFRIGAQFFLREGIRLESTNSNEDDFKKNLVMLRAEERGALAVYRPKAFCKVTGL